MQTVKVPKNVRLFNWGPTNGFQATTMVIPEGITLKVEEAQVCHPQSGDYVSFDTALIPGTNRIQAFALRCEMLAEQMLPEMA